MKILKSNQSTDRILSYIKNMVTDTLASGNNRPFKSIWVRNLKVMSFGENYITDFEVTNTKHNPSKVLEYSITFTKLQVQSFILEELEREIQGAAMSMGYSGR